MGPMKSIEDTVDASDAWYARRFELRGLSTDDERTKTANKFDKEKHR
jgi:hypothetical protein